MLYASHVSPRPFLPGLRAQRAISGGYGVGAGGVFLESVLCFALGGGVSGGEIDGGGRFPYVGCL